MRLFKIYLKTKRSRDWVIDILTFCLLIILSLFEYYLFLGNEKNSSFLDVVQGGLQNSLNIENIMILFFPILILLPFQGSKFPIMYYIRKPFSFLRVQVNYFYAIYIWAFVISGILFLILNKDNLKYDINGYQLVTMVIYFIAMYVFYNLIASFYCLTGNKIISLFLIYGYYQLEMFLNERGIRLFFNHGIISLGYSVNTLYLIQNIFFLLLFFIIVEVFQRWILSKKEYSIK